MFDYRYHNGDHYSSVRPKDQMTGIPKHARVLTKVNVPNDDEVKSQSTTQHDINKTSKEVKFETSIITDTEKMIMASTR